MVTCDELFKTPKITWFQYDEGPMTAFRKAIGPYIVEGKNSSDSTSLLNRDNFPLKRECSLNASLVKQEGQTLSISRLKCKNWFCPRCGPKRKRQLQWLAKNGQPNKFITLTASPASGTTPKEKARRLKEAWKKLRRKAAKKWNGATIQFLCVFEQTKQGNPHLHILARSKYIPQNWISNEMMRLTKSPIVDVRKIRNTHHAAFYVTKYLSKAPHRFPGCKRYWRSQLWKKPSENQPEQLTPTRAFYYLVPQSPHKCIPTLIKKGFTLTEFAEPYQLIWVKANPPPARPGHTTEVY